MPATHPYTLRWTSQHPLARMLPLFRYQAQVYRLGERLPPSALIDHAPMWEHVEFKLDPMDSLQARVNLQRDFTLVSKGANCSSNANGGFRVHFYDLKQRYRFQDRGVNFGNFGGPVSGIASGTLSPAPFYLREPYRFPVPDSQILIEVQSFEEVPNTVNLVYYGQVLRFNAPGLTFPGGPVTGWDWAKSLQHFHGQGGRHR
jgi:hypothetical protein